MNIVRGFLFLVVISAVLPAQGQTVSTLPVEEQIQEGYFLYEVKLVDEFIERFNDEPDNYIRQQCKALYGFDSIITRKRLLKSLFDKKSTWGIDTSLFISQVLAKSQYLSFTDSNWYAEAQCTFNMEGSNVLAPLILHIRQENGGAKWMIAGLGQSDIYKRKVTVLPISSVQKSIDDFIPTSSHGTNFIVLSQVLTSGLNENAYFEPELLKTERALQLVTLIKQRKATFKYAKTIRYHFFNINGWTFTVDYFKRKDTNSGWLISDLRHSDIANKNETIKKLLYP